MRNKNLKRLIIPMIVLTIITCVIITVQTINQYKELTLILNGKIAEIVGMIEQNYPEVDSSEIISILNSDKYGGRI